MIPMPSIDPGLYDQPDLRRALAERDISVLYRALKEAGLSQRQIAALTGQSQSEVSEILKGRVVMAYDVLARIADGLGVPRAYLGLSYGDEAAYRGGVPDTDPGELDEMLCRHLLALGGVAITGAAVTSLGELLAELPGPPPVPLPAQSPPCPAGAGPRPASRRGREPHRVRPGSAHRRRRLGVLVT